MPEDQKNIYIYREIIRRRKKQEILLLVSYCIIYFVSFNCRNAEKQNKDKIKHDQG